MLAPAAPGDSEALLAQDALQDIAGQNIVIFRGDGGREHLARALAARGARVEYAECYRRARPQVDLSPVMERLRAGEIRAICASSGESLGNLREMVPAEDWPLLLATPLFVPHPRIGEVAHGLGFREVVVAVGGDGATVEALATFFAKV